MLEKLFYNIGWFYTKIRFFNKKDVVQSFTTFLYQNSRILVIMPFELGEFDIARTTMFKLKDEWPNLQISLVVQAQYLTYSGLIGHFDIFALSLKDINKFSLPSRKFLKPILRRKYDIVIDFNRVMNLTASFISKSIMVKYRISFTKEYVDEFFNVQFNQESVSIHDEKNIYHILMNNLKMFCSNEFQKTEAEIEAQIKAEIEAQAKTEFEAQIDDETITESDEVQVQNPEVQEKTEKEEKNIAREEKNENKKQSKRKRSKYKNSGQKN